MKCELCKAEIRTTFLGKIRGTYLRRGKRKLAICFQCQKRYKWEEIRERLLR
jgi:uncharacterized protein with PIN domain